jgi:hypothetical protein
MIHTYSKAQASPCKPYIVKMQAKALEQGQWFVFLLNVPASFPIFISQPVIEGNIIASL